MAPPSEQSTSIQRRTANGDYLLRRALVLLDKVAELVDTDRFGDAATELRSAARCLEGVEREYRPQRDAAEIADRALDAMRKGTRS